MAGGRRQGELDVGEIGKGEPGPNDVLAAVGRLRVAGPHQIAGERVEGLVGKPQPVVPVATHSNQAGTLYQRAVQINTPHGTATDHRRQDRRRTQEKVRAGRRTIRRPIRVRLRPLTPDRPEPGLP
jgi:hypothetical protein